VTYSGRDVLPRHCLATCPVCGFVFEAESRREYVVCEGCGVELSHCREVSPCRMGTFANGWVTACCDHAAADATSAPRDRHPAHSGVFVLKAG